MSHYEGEDPLEEWPGSCACRVRAHELVMCHWASNRMPWSTAQAPQWRNYLEDPEKRAGLRALSHVRFALKFQAAGFKYAEYGEQGRRRAERFLGES